MKSMPKTAKFTPCQKCGNETYTIQGTKIVNGQVTIQAPTCTKCGTPLQSVNSHQPPIVGNVGQ